MLESASGRAYLAFASPDERAELLRTLEAEPENAANNTLALFKAGVLVRDIVSDGFATAARNVFTLDPGKTSSIAVPVYEERGICGAITLTFFASAMSMKTAVKEYAAILRAAAHEVSLDLSSENAGRCAA
jgi:IclR family mhp operon transcriptional activator